MSASRRPRRTSAVRPGPVSAAEATERTALIIRVATEEFLAKGFQGATLGEIARRCRISKTTLYDLFESKEALFSHVVTESIANFRSSIEGVLDVRRPLADVVRDVIAVTMDATKEKPANRLLRLVVAESGRFPAMAHLTRERTSALMAPVARYFREVAPHLSAEDASLLARHLSNMASGGFARLLGVPSLYADRDDWIDSVSRIFLAGFPTRSKPSKRAARCSSSNRP